ncbi:MAG: hypothetical protein COA84_04875 [Robiginitomaculum sp.]|nr:MAG: hypothetical protein COA84_04875 [Robiginitomaculum sp.]
MSKKHKIKTVFKFFLVWQEGAESAWLHQQSAKGWHLQKVWPFVYRFEKGEPCDLVYRLDFQTGTENSLTDYFQLCADAGWKHVCDFASWRYFCADADIASSAEFFSDARSQIAKYRRVLGILALLALPILYLSLIFIPGTISEGDFSTPALYVAVKFLYVILTGFLVYSSIAIILKIRKLKHQDCKQ